MVADKDRSERGKEVVAYFIPKFATNYVCFGKLGHNYTFSKVNPAKVTLQCDIDFFRNKQDLMEIGDSIPKITESKTAPPTSSPTSEIVGDEKIILRGDTIKEIDEEDEFAIDKPKKKKKKKNETELLDRGKKKKKIKKDKEALDDWEEDED